MKVDLKLFAIAIFLLAIPVLMALPQSFLVSDVVLSQDKQGKDQQPGDEERRMPLFGKITAIHNATLEISNANGDNVTVKYVGVAWSTGKQFDASWDSNTTFPFVLGQGNVIPGWDTGVVGMKVGGVIENIFMRNVEVGRVAEAVLTIDLLYDTGDKGPHKPVVRNVALDHVTSTSSPRVMWVVGFPGAVIEDVRFSDCTFRGVEASEVMHHAGSFSFKNVTIEPAKKGASLNSPQAMP